MPPATGPHWRRSAPPSPTNITQRIVTADITKRFYARCWAGTRRRNWWSRSTTAKRALYAACLGAARKNEALFALLHAMRGTAHLALVTTGSRRNATEILDHFHCRELFELILTSEDVTRNKPDPEGYLTAMAHFGASAADTMIF